MICEIFGFTEATGFLACNEIGKCVCWFDGIAIMMCIAILIGIGIGFYTRWKEELVRESYKDEEVLGE